jgi:hypothetical protein
MKIVLLSLLALAPAAAQTPAWHDVVNQRLHMYGSGNWIVIADSAFPLQSSPGIETIVSNDSHVETLHYVLEAFSKQPHLRPVVYVDKELRFISEADAPGIGAWRQLLAGLCEKFLPERRPAVEGYHETLIHDLAETAKSYHVLVVKTNMALPYTSVFIQPRPGYWNDDAERRLRENLK